MIRAILLRKFTVFEHLLPLPLGEVPRRGGEGALSVGFADSSPKGGARLWYGASMKPRCDCKNYLQPLLWRDRVGAQQHTLTIVQTQWLNCALAPPLPNANASLVCAGGPIIARDDKLWTALSHLSFRASETSRGICPLDVVSNHSVARGWQVFEQKPSP